MKDKIFKKLNNPILFALFGVTILIMSVVGAAYAYFQALASNNGISGTAPGAGSLSLVVTKLSTGATGRLVPVNRDLTDLNKAALGEGNTSGNHDAAKQCIDKNGYTVCQVYKIEITNNGSSAIVISGGVTKLFGSNTPNLTCTIMSDDHTVTAIEGCVGGSTLANNEVLNAGVKNTYYIMVFINNLTSAQTDKGKFNGTVEFNTGVGGFKARFRDTAEEKIEKLFTKTGTVTEGSSSNTMVLDVDATHKLIKDSMANIRYYGSNPNNYILFNCEEYPDTNCETWRIIGVVDGRVKIMRGSSIGLYSWDTSDNTTAGNSGNGINEWSQADIMKLLNPGYESETVGGSLYYNHGSGNCYNGQSNANESCDFTSIGIKNDETRAKIADAVYYTGAWSSSSIFPTLMMTKERGAGVGKKTNDGITRTTTWTGKIGLVYPSDYGYATDLSLCVNKNLSAYNNSTCRSNNWMRNILTNSGAKSGRLMTPRSSYADYIWYVNTTGEVKHSGYAYAAGAMTPVLYLDAEEVIESGEGTSANPYKLSD